MQEKIIFSQQANPYLPPYSERRNSIKTENTAQDFKIKNLFYFYKYLLNIKNIFHYIYQVIHCMLMCICIEYVYNINTYVI